MCGGARRSQTDSHRLIRNCRIFRPNHLRRFGIMVWRVRPTGRPNEFITGVHLCVSDRVAPKTVVRRGDVYYTAFVQRQCVRSAIFLISDFLATIWPPIEIFRSLVLHIFMGQVEHVCRIASFGARRTAYNVLICNVLLHYDCISIVLV